MTQLQGKEKDQLGIMKLLVKLHSHVACTGTTNQILLPEEEALWSEIRGFISNTAF